MENHRCSSYHLVYAVRKKGGWQATHNFYLVPKCCFFQLIFSTAGRFQLSKCASFFPLVSYWKVVTCILIFCGLFWDSMIFPLMQVESIFFNLFWKVNIFITAKKNLCASWIWMTKSNFLLSINVKVSCNILSHWAQLVSSLCTMFICPFWFTDPNFEEWIAV